MKTKLILAASLIGSLYACQQQNTGNPATTAENQKLDILSSIDKLKEDKNIIWMGEYSNSVSWDLSYAKSHGLVSGGKAILTKMIQKDDYLKADYKSISDYTATELLLTIVNNTPNIKLYKDAALTQVISPEERKQLLTKLDSIEVFDAETFARKIEVVRNEVDFSKCKTVHLKEQLYFDQNKSQFTAQIAAIGLQTSQGQDSTGNRTFWIPVENIANPADLSNSDVTLAFSAPHKFSLKKGNTLKGNSPEIAMEALLKAWKEQKENTTIYPPDGSGVLMSNKDVSSLLGSVDSIETFDSKTLERKMEVVNREIDGLACLSNFSSIYSFYWNQAENKLMVHNQYFCIYEDVVANGLHLGNVRMAIQKRIH